MYPDVPLYFEDEIKSYVRTSMLKSKVVFVTEEGTVRDDDLG